MAAFEDPAPASPPPIARVNFGNLDQAIHESRSSTILTICIATQAIVTFFFLLRLISRIAILRTWKVDDYLLSIAYALSLAITGLGCLGPQYGAGRHVETVAEADRVTILKLDYGIRAMYNPALAFAKLSMCALYMRVFSNRGMGIGRLVVKCCIAFIIPTAMAVEFVTVFPCIPLSSAWSILPMSERPGMCLHFAAEYYVSAGVNFFSDVWLLATVLPKMITLRIHLAEKITLLTVLSLAGFFVVLASLGRAIRIVAITKKANTDNTWLLYEVYLWSQLEIGLTIFCACIPTIRPLYRWLLPESLRNGPLVLEIDEEDEKPSARNSMATRGSVASMGGSVMSVGGGLASRRMSQAGSRASLGLPPQGILKIQLPPRIMVEDDMTPGSHLSPGPRSPGARSPGPRSPGARSPGARSPGGRANRPSFSPGAFSNTPQLTPLSGGGLSPMGQSFPRRGSSYFPLQPVQETSKELE